LFCCHKVFYHQLNAWIVHGQLVDICEEFFIHKINFSGQSAAGVKNTAQANENEKQMNTTKLSVNTVSNVNMIGQILAMAAENFGATDDFGELDASNIENEWNISYTLRISMLPHSYISTTLANKILFIGKAVRVLQSKKTKQEDRIPLDELQAFSEAIMKMSKISEFNVILFSKIIEEIRECVASRLWHLVVVKADLQMHLKSIKDFFLLSRGEFFQTFLQDSRHIMSLPPRTSAQDDLNMGPLVSTISKLRLEDDSVTNKFKLKLRSFSFQFKDFSTLTGLVYDGDIRFDQQSNVLRITSTKNSSRSGCLWHSLKQRIDLGFKTSFAFKFVNPSVQSKPS
jgi:gamma-tubulin complex component 4